MVIVLIFNEIYIRYSDVKKITLFLKLVFIAETVWVLGYTKLSQCIIAYEGKFFKTNFEHGFCALNVVKFLRVTPMLSWIVCSGNGCP